ncbi:hypothetical protein [Parabacteroides sp. PF5-9]|uniref:hypothetical protein n=1 Tax=Parabacteroides sp. PF5-9 TaxID=1742404 RepID=UPI002474E540|nr:hypothetical protein [Parabacteroides sp. PF5-9]MDH6359161.1 hypothetical protein [Parabacteroides sp. PF5-9]
MEINELKLIWQEQNEKLEKLLKLNTQTLHQIQIQKVRSPLRSLYWQRIFEITSHAIALLLLVLFLCYNLFSFAYAISALVLIVFYTYLFFNCLSQIKRLRSIDSDNDILTMQRALMQIQTYLIKFHRLTILFIPAFLSYPVVLSKAFKDLHITVFGDFDILKLTNGSWWYVELVTLVVMIPLGVWYYNQLSVKHSHKAWVRRIIDRVTSLRVKKALQFLDELEHIEE